MTETRSSVSVPAPENSPREATSPGVRELVARLRDAADRMVAFSRTKTLLRDAATTIEQLDGHRAAQTRVQPAAGGTEERGVQGGGAARRAQLEHHPCAQS